MVDSHTNYNQNLANDLKEYGKEYSKRNLEYMSIFAKKFSNEKIAQQPAAKILWFTLVEIIYKSKSHEEMQLNKERNINI